jgi:excisionase family DNA binding protein
MARRRVNPRLVKRNRSYTASELAERLGVHRNTVRHWQRKGLKALDDGRPALFHGETLRTFLLSRSAQRKRPCPPGTFYCFRCRDPRRPALAMVDYVESRPGTGNLRALCETCEAVMHRRARRSALDAVMPGIAVQIREAQPRLGGSASPSLKCDSGERGSSR